MKTLVQMLLACLVIFLPAVARATLTCSFQTVPVLNFVTYTANSTHLTNSNNLRQMQVTALCTRAAAGDSTTVHLGASDGANAQGQSNRMVLSGNYLIYDLFKESGCATRLRNNNTNARVAATIPAAPLNTQNQVIFDFWGCINQAQAVTGFPSGSYVDMVALELWDGNTKLATSSLSVQDFILPTCTITNGPANILFTYQGFGAADLRSASFNANCTNGLAYTMSLTPPSGAVGGVRYTLGLTAVTPGTVSNTGPSTLSDTGNATGTRVYYVNGLMQAGQAGQAGTPVPQPHTLMLTY